MLEASSGDPSPTEGFTLKVEPREVQLGEKITVILQNTSGEQQGLTANRSHFNIEYRTTKGWESIYWVPDSIAWTVEGYYHEPCGGFAWEFAMTQSGLMAVGHPHYHVCDPPSPGSYRFVFWGLPDDAIHREFAVTSA